VGGGGFEVPVRVSASVTILEGGTLGLDLLPWLDGMGHLLLIDVVRRGQAPGEIVRLEGKEVAAVLSLKISPHQVGVQDLLAAARLTDCEPAQVVLWGMEPERLEAGTGFSLKVADALPRLLEAVLNELSRWGVTGRPLEAARPHAIWWEEPRAGVRESPRTLQ